MRKRTGLMSSTWQAHVDLFSSVEASLGEDLAGCMEEGKRRISGETFDLVADFLDQAMASGEDYGMEHGHDGPHGEKYGHIGRNALRSAVEAVSGPKPKQQKPAESFDNPFEPAAKPDGDIPN